MGTETNALYGGHYGALRPVGYTHVTPSSVTDPSPCPSLVVLALVGVGLVRVSAARRDDVGDVARAVLLVVVLARIGPGISFDRNPNLLRPSITKVF